MLMEDRHVSAMLMGFVFILALSGVVVVLKSGATGNVAAYQQYPHWGGVGETPDPSTWYVHAEDGWCQMDINGVMGLIERLCRKGNPGRAQKEGLCRRHAEADFVHACTPAASWESWGPPQYITGEVAIDPLGCASLAGDYDVVLQQTFEHSNVPAQTIAMVNPCSDVVEAATRYGMAGEYPMREFMRTQFSDGSVIGHSIGDENAPGSVRYVRCSDGTARVIVSGVPVCNTL